MPLLAVAVEIPHYVLMDENRRIGPKIMRQPESLGHTAIYGFSNKRAFDTFCGNSLLKLRPYPLVEGYLRDQADARGDRIELVVIDAAGPQESSIHAVTIEAILEAQVKKATQVAADYRLLFDSDATAYRLEEPT